MLKKHKEDKTDKAKKIDLLKQVTEQLEKISIKMRRKVSMWQVELEGTQKDKNCEIRRN